MDPGIQILRPSLMLDVSIMKSGFYLVWCFGDEADAHKHAYMCRNCFRLTHPEEVVWPGKTQPMLLPKSSSGSILSIRSVALRVCLAKVLFLDFFSA